MREISIELNMLTKRVIELFGIHSVKELGSALMSNLENYNLLNKFKEIVENDLSKDWLQMIYQYHEAERKEKKQDFTPESLGKLLTTLLGDANQTIDMCAGTGALTIQRWNDNPGQEFILLEVDSNIIPYLLFNLVIRNIEAKVLCCDVLSNETSKTWIIKKGEEYGKCINV